MRVSVGVDLHKSQFTVYYRYEGTGEGMLKQYRTHRYGYEKFLCALRGYKAKGVSIEVAVEATGNARYFKNVVESEALRRILKSRKSLVRAIVSIKNQVHGLLLGSGIESRKGDLQSAKKRQQILNVLAEHGYADATVKPLLETIDRLSEKVKKLEDVLIELVKEDRAVEVVMSIPGAGIITASTISAFVDDINRFNSYKEFSSYAGLAPWVQTSNTTEHYGKITKRGPEPLHTAIVQIVLGMVRSRRTNDYRIMKRYKAMKPYKGSGKTIIATARKLSKIIWYMLKNDTLFDPFKMTDPKIQRIMFEMRKEAMELESIPA